MKINEKLDDILNSHKKILLVLFLIWLIRTIIVYFYISDVNGPFSIDETAYMDTARLIHLEGNAGWKYNPLYPFITGFFLYFKNMIVTYELIKVFNIAVFSSIIFPMFYISKKFISPGWSVFISLITVSLPFGAISFMVMAEPLFYALYIWTVLFLLNYIDSRKRLYGILMGIFLGLLFLTKQSGLILFISVIMVLLYDIIFEKKLEISVKNHLLSLIPAIIMIITWIARNLFTKNAGALGYGADYAQVDKLEYIDINYIISIFYNISYLTIGSYFIFFLLFLLTIFRLKELDFLSTFYYSYIVEFSGTSGFNCFP